VDEDGPVTLRRPDGGSRQGSGPFGRLLHLGNVVVDVVLTVIALPERGGDVLATRTQTTPGGGFNVMAAAQRQSLRVAYGGAHGSGVFGTLARVALAGEGIQVLLPPKPDIDTGFVVTIVEPGGERTFLTSPGAEATLTAEDLEQVDAARGDAVYLSGYSLAHAANRAALLGWLKHLEDGHIVVFDPGPLVRSLPADALGAVLGRADWLTCNVREATALSGCQEPGAAARALSGRHGPAGVLVRAGADGCVLGLRGEAPVRVPGFRVDVVDTNGAGDTHTGTFLAALAAGETAAEAARRANAAAALSVSRPGPATAPTTGELARFLAGS
jgi:sugar/nucleoside kinase (ribokinase family)